MPVRWSNGKTENNSNLIRIPVTILLTSDTPEISAAQARRLRKDADQTCETLSIYQFQVVPFGLERSIWGKWDLAWETPQYEIPQH